jgi:L-lactate dehydrogenase complex protein LldF
MNKTEKKFLKDSVIAYDLNHRKILNFNISKYDQAFKKGIKRYIHYKESRRFASQVKANAIANLAGYLREFEKNIKSRGAEVIWATDTISAIQTIHQILKENNTRLIVKSKSMITEEIGFNESAEKEKIEAVETDLGEFIVQTAGEKPYHILTPAMHKSKENVAALFHHKFGTKENATPEEIASYVRIHLRKLFTEADACMTGANFIVADIGGISLTENEGNGLMSVSFPRLHIVLAGIERVIPSVKYLPFFFQWLGVHGTGQHISAYNSLLLGPRSISEKDGPEKMVVILLDNRRSTILAQKEEYQALKCIRCGTCLNACPVYRNIGGYTYSATYTGPIGSLITPFSLGFKEFGHLSYACSLCGKCTEACPVQIPLHEMLLLNRKRKRESSHTPFTWDSGMKIFRYIFLKRKRIDFFNSRLKNKILRMNKAPFGEKKESPDFAATSFSQQWKTLKL